MKKQKNKIYYATISLFVGIITLLILAVVTTIATWIFRFMDSAGMLNERNYRLLWLFDYSAVCTILGAFLSIIAIHRPAKKMAKLLEAMEKISNGDFSVRLKKQDNFFNSRGKAVDMFNTMAQQLESTEILNHDFINNFSHELKTPIASINGFAKLLKNDNLSDEEKNEYLDIIIQESDRLSGLSTNILRLSRLEQQSILTNKSEFNVTEQIRIIIGSLYHKWSEKNIDIELFGEDTSITANKELLGQVWINLLDNAIKFSPKNKTVTVEISKNNSTICVSIKNFGKTVPSEHQNRIFDKFYQGDESHFTAGNGLGLPMVKRIIELHEGVIIFDPSLDEQTKFEISLPI